MKIKVSIIAILFSLSLVGCSNNIDNKQNEQRHVQNQEQTNNSTKIKNKEDKSNKEGESNKYEDDKKEESEFKIYTLDYNDTDKKIEFLSLTMDESKSLEEKLNELCIALQKEYFKEGNAKIILKGIDEENIATINLVNEVTDAWSKHFAGSTGGYISQTTIIETLLQKEYKGKWIKGLKVLIDGKDSQDIYNHAPFGEIFYR